MTITTCPPYQSNNLTMANHKSKNGKSLNDCLHVGQDLLANLVLMVIKFRAARFCFSVDIKRMFHQLALTKDSQEFLRFFALVEKEGQIKLEAWRARTLPFGLCCSPYLACFVMQQHAKKFQDDPKLASTVTWMTSIFYLTMRKLWRKKSEMSTPS